MIKFTHGKSGYNRGCRCDVCMIANRSYQRKFRSTHIGGTIAPDKHGAYYTYITLGCRCDACKEAGRKTRELYYKRCREAHPSPETDTTLKHGTAATYSVYACRCDLCRASVRPSAKKVTSARMRARIDMEEDGAPV